MAETTTDRPLGIALVCGVVATLGALYTLVSGHGPAGGYGFAVAVAFGAFAVAALHAFE